MNLKPLLLSPLFVPQALWVMARATRLPEAEGARQGWAGAGPGLRLIVLGDSSAAGVGAPNQDQALIGHLVQELAHDYTVDWQLNARSGATTASALLSLDQLASVEYDAAFVCLGINDVKNGVRLGTWHKNYSQLCDRLKQEFGVQHLFLSGLPPIRNFPLLPWPLNEVLGARAARFDQVLRGIASGQKGATFVPLDVTLDPKGMAADGFHPGPTIYADWGAGLAAIMRDTLIARDKPQS